MKAVRDYYKNLGAEFEKALNDMIIFDALILTRTDITAISDFLLTVIQTKL